MATRRSARCTRAAWPLPAHRSMSQNADVSVGYEFRLTHYGCHEGGRLHPAARDPGRGARRGPGVLVCARRRNPEHDSLRRPERRRPLRRTLEQGPPEYRASAKAPDADLRMPPVTSVGNDWYGRQTRELEYKHRREGREKQLEKMDQEYRALQQQEAGPRAESAARKTVKDAVDREKRLQERQDTHDARAAEHATWLKSCERQERIVEHDRARHRLAYG